MNKNYKAELAKKQHVLQRDLEPSNACTVGIYFDLPGADEPLNFTENFPWKTPFPGFQLEYICKRKYISCKQSSRNIYLE